MRSLLAATMLLFALPALADMPLATSPAWTSSALGHVATGGGWADLDGDGYLDLVAANGNDIHRQNIVVYRGDGSGGLPLSPSWSSSDIDYHGHLDLGDVNGDGFTDLVVGVYLGPGGFGDPGTAKLYLGTPGAGFFTDTPVWTPATDFYCFRVALGDVDGDGDLDLACSSGESYYGYPERQRVFLNVGGTFESTPSWLSDESGYALDVTWADVDLDGDLDLAFSGEDDLNRVYFNDQTTGGGLATSAGWTSGDGTSYSNTIALGDWDGDGYPDFAAADNSQLGGQGRFKVYANSLGTLATTPSWTSATGGYGSHVSWVDLDLDGDLDLAAGRWWGAVRLYENDGGLSGSPVWTSSTSSVIENMFWGDVDNDGLRTDGLSTAYGDGARTYVKLAATPIRDVAAVRIDGLPLGPADYAVHRTKGWISLAAPPAPGEVITVEFSYSHDLDLGVTNWDGGVGNYMFLNEGTLVAVPGESGLPGINLAASPNPLRRSTVLRYAGDGTGQAELAIFDVQGRRLRVLHQGPLGTGLRSWEWNGKDDGGSSLAAGVYFAFLRTGGERRGIKLILLK
jgi:hypothetical protein